MKKLVVTLLGLAVATVAGLAGAGDASAAPLQQINTNGNTHVNFGDHSFCRGAVTYKLDVPARKRGVVRVTAISHGFRGEGATWKRNPKCTFRIRSGYTSARGIEMEKWNRVSFGPRPGEKKSWEVTTGSGLATMAVTTWAVNTPVRISQSASGATFFFIVP
ncbi:enoyl-CoA hydratase [Gordonia westfalica]|uniref:Enoyl-CoA hydratase n=1 Tax=Gordonia westfalica TaxID=158898 RepID=A0A1H2KGT0_9ACTN|nr:enoyl-CoA hydratase [Gordonia westfalica]SDU67920.1 hypothetical protein SAMN04488548_1343239 [Gordonia westfalica]